MKKSIKIIEINDNVIYFLFGKSPKLVLSERIDPSHIISLKSKWLDPEVEELKKVFKLKNAVKVYVMNYAHRHHAKSVDFSYSLKCAWTYYKISVSTNVTFTKKSGEVTKREICTPRQLGYIHKHTKEIQPKPDLFIFADRQKYQNGEENFIISFNLNQLST